MTIDIIATLGPSLLTSTRINSFVDEGVTIFRLNGAHMDAYAVASIVEKARRHPGYTPRTGLKGGLSKQLGAATGPRAGAGTQ